jgi:cephalosporin hydroxylase
MKKHGVLVLLAIFWTRTVWGGSVRQALVRELWNDDDPFTHANPSFVDTGYPHTHIRPEAIDLVLKTVKPTFWLEAGSMLGGSLIKTAEAIDRSGLYTDIVSVDPFTGDVNMWAWEHGGFLSKAWRFLRLENGHTTIYDRFIANVNHANQSSKVVPIVTTATVGFKLIERLHAERRIPELPQVIYLDSAHEEHETLIELRLAWGILQPGGVLWGDDWLWEGVNLDLKKFAKEFSSHIDKKAMLAIHKALPQSTIEVDSIVLYEGQWFLCKPPVGQETNGVRALEVVASVCHEDVTWLRKEFPDLVVCAKRACLNHEKEIDESCSLDVNKGHEVSSFVKYIISRYDNLPDSVAFVHGHESAWHQPPNFADTIRRAKTNITGYVSLNARFLGALQPQHLVDVKEMWANLMAKHLGPFPCTDNVYPPCCAQFAVTRERIRAVPLALWEDILEFSIGRGWDRSQELRRIEFVWHMLFGQPCIMPTRDEKTYVETFF